MASQVLIAAGGQAVYEAAKQVANQLVVYEENKLKKRAYKMITDLEQSVVSKVRNFESRAINYIEEESKALVLYGQQHLPWYHNNPLVKAKIMKNKIARKRAAMSDEKSSGVQLHSNNIVELTELTAEGFYQAPSAIDVMVDDSVVNSVLGGTRSSKSGGVISKKMPYGRSKRKRGSSKYVTKRGVKRIIKDTVALIGDCEFIRQSSLFIRTANDGAGNVDPIGTGALLYGKRAIFSWTWDNRNAWFVGTDSYQDRIKKIVSYPTPGGADAPPSDTVYLLSHGKIFLEFHIHNPMNEVVQATFWWLKCVDDTNLAPEETWKTMYENRDALSGVAIPWDAAFFDYPTKYDHFNDHWEIKKKFQVTFQPGETKKLTLTIPKAKLAEVDVDATNAYIKNITHNLMCEIMGVPTGQVTAGNYVPNTINFTPASLELIYWSRTKIGGASQAANFTGFHSDSRGTVTAGQSLIPEVSATIGEK